MSTPASVRHTSPRAHRLSDVEFAAVASGRPDPATVAELRRAQLSRHLLLLRQIVRAAPAAATPLYQRLAAAEHTAAGQVRELLGRPLFGVWAAGCLAALRAGTPPADSGLGHLAILANTALRHHDATGGTDAAAETHTTGETDTTTAARRVVVEHAGLRLDVRLDDVDPLRTRLGLAPTGRLTDAELRVWQDRLRSAWRLLATRHRDHAEVISAVLTCIVPVQPDRGAAGLSASSADAFGAVAMSTPADATALAVGLLHETQHSLLNAVLYLFDLIRPPQDGPGHTPPLVYSPWRDDPRPPTGLLHGAYAYLGVTDFWRMQRHDGDPVAAFEFARWRAALAAATDDLLGGGALTPAGTRFVGALRERLLPWLDEPVPAAVQRLAEGANTDHRLRWRLRNLTVDDAQVAALAAAWRSGAPAPPSLPEAIIRPWTGRVLESSARLTTTHRVLRGAHPDDSKNDEYDSGDAGDLAYLRGDSVAAVAAYRRGLIVAPGDHAAWAGMGLVLGSPALHERPEVVAAVHQRLADGTSECIDPVEVADWLGSAARRGPAG